MDNGGSVAVVTHGLVTRDSNPATPPGVGHSIAGFTLLELIVAISIFAIMAVMVYGGLNNVLITRQQSEQHAEQLRKLQTAFSLLERDVEQTVNRAIRNEYGEYQNPLIGNNFEGYLLELTHAGWRNPSSAARSSLQRVAYALDEKKFVRAYWYVLDRAEDTKAFKTVLLDDVTSVEIRYLGQDDEWHLSWPDTQSGADKPSTDPPRGVEVTIETENFGKVTRLFQVPG